MNFNRYTPSRKSERIIFSDKAEDMLSLIQCHFVSLSFLCNRSSTYEIRVWFSWQTCQATTWGISDGHPARHFWKDIRVKTTWTKSMATDYANNTLTNSLLSLTLSSDASKRRGCFPSNLSSTSLSIFFGRNCLFTASRQVVLEILLLHHTSFLYTHQRRGNRASFQTPSFVTKGNRIDDTWTTTSVVTGKKRGWVWCTISFSHETFSSR